MHNIFSLYLEYLLKIKIAEIFGILPVNSKKYIDGIAFAHTISYNKVENVPDKFLKKLSNLLGWKLSDSFSELDLFQYLAGNADGAA